jgi:hypothetical protein
MDKAVVVTVNAGADALARLGLDLHRRQIGHGRRVLADAYAAGEAAGKGFDLFPAITEAA